MATPVAHLVIDALSLSRRRPVAEPLGTLERKVYEYLVDFLGQHTYQPSIREIAKEFHIKSTKTVSDLLHALAKKGYIERDRARSRGVRIVGYPRLTRIQPVPFYGRIHAGEPALLNEHRKGFITMDRRFLPGEDAFAMRVKGDSMIGRGILDGDFVFVHPSPRADDGVVIAARLGDEATVKTLTHRGATIVLEPANPADRPIEVGPEDDFAVLGTVCGIFRPFLERPEGEDS
ncbi:MAG: transcriptional repressor LexA [Gemmatimonadaceae bacterium]